MRSLLIRATCALFIAGVLLEGAPALAADTKSKTPVSVECAEGKGTPLRADAKIIISSPRECEQVKADQPVNVVYAITPNPGGDHSHIYVNGKEAGILRKLKSTFPLDPLPPGTHTLCIKVVNKGHASIGQESCVRVIAS